MSNSYGSRLKQARKAAGLTQRQLGKLVGQAATTIANLEQGGTRSSTRTAALARALGVRPEWLEEGVGSMLFDLKAPRMQVAAPAIESFTFTSEDLQLAQQIHSMAPAQRQAVLAMILAFSSNGQQQPTEREKAPAPAHHR